MRKGKRKVFVVCEDHEYKDINKVIGLFPSREEAENCIRAKGEVLCWKADYFMPFALVWAQVQSMHKDYGSLSTWCWIEVHEVDLPFPKPQFYKEVIAMVIGIIFVLLGVVMDHHSISDALVLIGCIGALIGCASAFLKA
ncbi:hypothetical protein BH10CYA1_BH10CYA1_19640 [soil metagenome]